MARPVLVACAAALALAACAQLLPPPRTLDGVRPVPTFTSTTTSSVTSTSHCVYHGWRVPDIDPSCTRWPC